MNARQIPVRASAVLCALALALGSGAGAAAQDDPPPPPSIRVSTSNDYLRGDNFTPGGLLSFTAYSAPDMSLQILQVDVPIDALGYAFIDGGEHGVDLAPGNFVVASDGAITRALVLEPLTIEVFDPSTDYVSGTATPGELVEVIVGNNVIGYPAYTSVYADPTGFWEVSFLGTFDIAWDMWGSAHVYDEDWDATVYHQGPTTEPPPSPWFSVFPEWEYVEAWNWPLGNEVTATVTHADLSVCSGSALSGNPPWDENAIVAEISLPEGCSVAGGDLVSVSDGITTKDHAVTALEVTGLDPVENIIEGWATAGLGVEVWVHEVGGSNIFTSPEADGHWGVDMDDVGYDLEPGSGGRARQVDGDGDETALDWSVTFPPNPFIWADPVNDAVNGWDWPEGETLTFELFDAGGNLLHSESAVVEGGMSYDLRALEIDLQAGHRIVLASESFTKEMIVTDLAITLYGETTETLQGVLDPTQGFWVNLGGQEPLTIEIVDDLWTASFGEVSPGMCGEVAQPDPEGDMTGIGFCVPNPHFTVFPEWEAMELWEWPIESAIVLSVEDPGTSQSPDFENGYTVPPADWNPYESFLWIDIAGAYDVKPGDVVTITGAGFAVTHTVRYLTVDAIDPAQNTVTGTADAGARVYVWPHDLGHWSAGLYVDADGAGNWTADLDDLGYNLLPGTSGRAEIVDEVGNTTGIDWTAPRPRMSVYLEGEFVIGWDWPHGASLHMTIDDPATGEGFDYEGDAVVEPAPFDPNTWWARFDFAGTYDVKPGDIVVLTDGTTVRTHVVYSLTVDVIDGEADTVAGTSDPGATVHVYPWGSYFGPTEADESGNWLMDFTELFDLVPGTWGTAEIDDEAWNATAIDWIVPLDIDIRPWSSANLEACAASWDLLPVAVLSESGFDATAVDHGTVRFGRTGTEAEVATIFGRPVQYTRDLDGDGMLDMVYAFRFGQTGFSCADIPLGQRYASVEAILTGSMGDTYLEGRNNLTLFRLLGH